LDDWVVRLKAKVPEVVIGDPATVKIDGAVRATLVTAVWNVASSLRKCVVPAEAQDQGTFPDAWFGPEAPICVFALTTLIAIKTPRLLVDLLAVQPKSPFSRHQSID